MRITEDAGWTLHRPRRRFRLGRGRVLPGPLRTVSQRRGTGSWLASFVVFGAAVVAIAVAVSGLAGSRAVDAQAVPEAPQRKAVAAVLETAQKFAEPTSIVRLQPISAAPVAEPVGAASGPIDRSRAAEAATASSAGEASPFKLDQLPVLATNGAGFEADAVAVPPTARSASRVGARRSAATGQR